MKILGQRRCGTCKFAETGDGGELECHWGPPTAYPLVAQDPKTGGIQLHGRITIWPQPKPEAGCHQWTMRIDLRADHATFDVYEP